MNCRDLIQNNQRPLNKILPSPMIFHLPLQGNAAPASAHGRNTGPQTDKEPQKTKKRQEYSVSLHGVIT